MPYIDIQLFHQYHHVTVSALVDSGATLNVLPFDVGVELGLFGMYKHFLLNLVEYLKIPKPTLY